LDKPLYDVIMPTYNQTDETKQAITSLSEMREVDKMRLIWIDNGSLPDHTSDIMGHIYTTGMMHFIIFNPENWGFPKATNLGIANSVAPYVIFLNNDVILRSDVFDTMREAIENTPNSMLASTVSTSGWQRPTRLAKRGWITEAQEDNEEYMPVVTTPRVLEREEHPAFFCTMITRECIQKIGYLSEEMGEGFGEDDDYNERIHAAGYKRLICLDAFVEHKHRTTFKALYSDKEIAAMQQQSMGVLRAKYGERVW